MRSRPQHCRRRSGHAILYMLVAVTVLAGFVALASDYAMLRMVKAELQGAVDAATRAACSGLAVSPAEARARAKAVAQQNTVNGKQFALTDADIELGAWAANGRNFVALPAASEATATAVRVTGRLAAARGTDVKLLWLPALGGQQSKSLSAQSVSTQTSGAQDIVLVQDVSGSFEGEIALARDGDVDLLDAQRDIGGTSSFGVVAFTGSARTISPLRNIAGNYTTLKTAVTSLAVGTSAMPSILSGTDIAAGMERGLSVFAAYGASSPNRAMVIVSDGEPTASWFGAHPGVSATQLLVLAQQQADLAWAEGISVFVVFWDSANSPTAAANLKTLIRGRGSFVHVTDPTKLSEAIGTVLSKTVTVK